MSAMSDLFEYNTWANGQVTAVFDTLPEGPLREDMPELGGDALELLGHLAKVEAAFLGLMAGGGRPGDVDSYASIKALLESNAAGYRAALPSLEADLERKFQVPWFGRAFTVGQALLQVATHSVQHRAGVCAGIARAGGEAPGLDYIMWLNQFR
jgi:uncharacterized damage-inducible protein DinB